MAKNWLGQINKYTRSLLESVLPTKKRALLQYRNMPHPDTRLSPAQVIYGRQIRDFFPVVNNKYEPKVGVGLVKEARLLEHTKKQRELPIGCAVAVQNESGRFPKKRDKSGVVLDNMKHDKVLIRLDGSKRLTARNRQFLKQIVPLVVSVVPSVPVVLDKKVVKSGAACGGGCCSRVRGHGGHMHI